METGDKVWEVFVQKKGGQPFKHAGSCHGYDKKMAIQNARDLYTRRGEGRALWVVPADAIVSVPFDEEDQDKLEDVMEMSDDEVVFWEKVGINPDYIYDLAEDGWENLI